MIATSRSCRPQFDTLEAREVLAAAVAPIVLVGNTDFVDPAAPQAVQTQVTKDAFGNLVIQGGAQNDRVTVKDVRVGGKTLIEVRSEVFDAATGQQLKLEVFQVQPGAFKGNAVTARSRLFFLAGDGNDYFKIQGNAAKQFSVLADGGAGNDEIWGGWNADLLRGGAGNDQLFGEAGHDTLLGEEGNDTLGGGTGNDLILGGFGFDAIHGDWGTLNKFSEGLNDRIDGGADGVHDDIFLDLRCRHGRDQWNPDVVTLIGQTVDLDLPHDVRAGDPDSAATGNRFADLFFAEVQTRKATGHGWFTSG